MNISEKKFFLALQSIGSIEFEDITKQNLNQLQLA